MRILHVTDVFLPHLGGIEVFVDDLSRRQIEAGHDVTVLTSQPGCVDDPADDLRVIAPRRFRFAPAPFRAGAEVATAGGYDVVHAHFSVLSGFTTAVAAKTAAAGIPTVNTVHSLWNGREFWVKSAAAYGRWRTSNAIWTAVSPVAARDVHAILGADTPVQVVPNAVDVDWWRRGAWSSREVDCLTVVSVMRLAGRKRPIPFVRMLARLRHLVPPEIGLRAVIIGDGPQKARVQAEVDRLGLHDWVEIPGRLTREEIREVFAWADVYAAPAYQESFGIAALEARAAGLPVVAMSSGGVGGFIEDGVEGMLVADDTAMVSALAGFATVRGRAAQMRRYNRTHPSTLGWDNALAGFELSYETAQEAVVPAQARAPRRLISRAG